MSGNASSYFGLLTKIRAMEGRKIRENGYDTISSLESVPEFITFLKGHDPYSHIFEKYEENTLHRAAIEQLLMSSLYEDYSRVFRFSTQSQRSVLSIIFFRFEISILKACLQTVYQGVTTYSLDSFDLFFKNHSSLNVQKLAMSSSCSELIGHLAGTEYYPLLAPFAGKEDFSLFDLEMKLDIHYFLKSWKKIKKNFARKDQSALLHIMGTKIDLANILWSYRFVKFYSPQQTPLTGYLIPIHYKLTKDNLVDLISVSAAEDFFHMLENSHYHKILKGCSEEQIEAKLSHYLDNVYHTANELYPHSIAPVLSYFHFKEQEIKRLITALECIRYGLPKEAFHTYLSLT